MCIHMCMLCVYIDMLMYTSYVYLRPYRGSPVPPPLCLVLYACSGLLGMHISVVAVMAAFGVKLGPRWSQVRALLEPSWAKLGLLEGVWGPCWAQKSVLGALLGWSLGHLGPKSQSRPPRVRPQSQSRPPKVRKLVSKSVQEPPWDPPTWSQNPT